MADEEEYRQLSELQHFVFCRRQWALIHLEQQWKDNLRTTEGNLMHVRVHDEYKTELRGDVLIVRDMRVRSDSLRVVGVCDAVEFYRVVNGISLRGRKGLWLPYPVEYKRGRPKQDECDIMQLCGQALCLEEMLCCHIKKGYLYYGETRHRLEVDFDETLRTRVRQCLDEMHYYVQRGYTPKERRGKGCDQCSLNDLCLPALERSGCVADYYRKHLGEIV